MKRPEDKQMRSKSIHQDADTVEQKYGEDAAIYAETRSEAAEQAGATMRADHWDRVSAEVEKRRNGDRRG